MNGKRLLSWGSYEWRISLAESPSTFVRDHLGKALIGPPPVLILTGGLPALNYQALFWGFKFRGLVSLPGSRYSGFLGVWILLGTSIPPAWWEQSKAIRGSRKCSRYLLMSWPCNPKEAVNGPWHTEGYLWSSSVANTMEDSRLS